MTNVLIVDDERMVQQLFISYIEKASDRYKLVAAIKDAKNADIYCGQNTVDLILMDICTANEQSGIRAAERIKKSNPSIKIIMVTSAPDYRFIDKSKRAGADSFWYKEVSDEELLSVMDRTMAGEHIFPDETPVVTLGEVKSTDLTEKELVVLGLLVKNFSIQEIANEMNVEYSTVRYHINNLKSKTGAKDITELCYLVAKNRLVLPEY